MALYNNTNISGGQLHQGDTYMLSTESESDLRVKILNWLSPLTFLKTHEDTRSKISSLQGYGPGQWFLKSDTFRRWKCRRLGRLWCYGMPGAGKTVMASIIIEDMNNFVRSSTNQNLRVAYLYLNYKERQSLEHLLGSVIRQILQGQDLPASVLESYEENKKKGYQSPTLKELSMLLQGLVQDEVVYIIVDALDEYPNDIRTQLVRLLEVEGSQSQETNLLILSRPLDEFRKLARDFVQVEISANGDDIKMFLQSQFELPRWEDLAARDPKLLADVEQAIINRCNGMFLLARLKMEELKAQLRPADVREKLERLPDKLDDTYDDTLERIRGQNPKESSLALNVLAWIVLSQKTLTVVELQHALSCDSDRGEIEPERLYNKDHIIDFCGGLVSESRGYVRLVHFTAHTYLRSRAEALFPGFHTIIAHTCIRFLSLKVFEETERFPQARDIFESQSSKLTDFEKLIKYPFVMYAAKYLGYHLREQREHVFDGVLEAIHRFARNRQKRDYFHRLLHGLRLDEPLHCHDYDSKENPPGNGEKHFTALHLAAFLGWVPLIQKLGAVELDVLDPAGRTPIMVAVQHGHFKAVSRFHDLGAELTSRIYYNMEIIIQVEKIMSQCNDNTVI